MKKTSDRSMQSKEEQLFFFPKRNPPVSVRARSREEAEKILQGSKNEK